MSRFLARIVGFFSHRTQVGVDKVGNKYFTRKEEIDGIMKEKRWVVFKGEADSATLPVEWICWLNGQRKEAPSPEEIMELEARRECVRQNVAFLKKEEKERKAKEGITGKRLSRGDGVEESRATMSDLRDSQEKASENFEVELESPEPTGSGASFKPGTWQPPT